mmetsp:Transcript_32394/g.89524  ORF Transcript_32394/g.89524 Transcript_32394/m.89524 type:complete len:361 (+) Transcript_32394:1679-2761(+)
MAQLRVAQLKLELGTEEPFHVGQRHDTGARLRPRNCRFLQNRAQAPLRFLPSGKWQRSCFRAGNLQRLLLHRTGLLQHGLGAAVWHHSPVRIAKDFLLRNGQLHDVAHLAQSEAVEKGQVARDEGLRARISAAGQRSVRLRGDLEVICGRRPSLGGVYIDCAVNVDEGRQAIDEGRRPIATLLGLHDQLGTIAAHHVQVSHVNVGKRVGSRTRTLDCNASGTTILALLCGHIRHVLLRETLAEQATERLQPVVVKALDRGNHLVHFRHQCWAFGTTALALDLCDCSALKASGTAFGAATDLWRDVLGGSALALRLVLLLRLLQLQLAQSFLRGPPLRTRAPLCHRKLKCGSCARRKDNKD